MLPPDIHHLCFLKSRSNIAIQNTSHHGAIKEMFSKRKHFAIDSKSYLAFETLEWSFVLPSVIHIAIHLIQYIYMQCASDLARSAMFHCTLYHCSVLKIEILL